MEPLTSLLSSLKAVDPEALHQEYNTVRLQALKLKKELNQTNEAGALKENIKKNRYKDILPYDQNRVVLSLLTSDSDSDYINASFIKGATSGRSYIACQGPLSNTVIDFWRMIWQHDVKVIVMACRVIEMGKKKCQCYWAEERQSAAFGPFTVSNEMETLCNDDVIVRNLTVTFQQSSRSLVHYQFLSWPDHDVPYEAAGVLDLLVRTRNSQGTHTGPMVVHCSAGCGRTGVICSLDYIRDLLVTKKIGADFSIKQIVQDIRIQRPSAVQTKEQYQFIFIAATCMLERVLQAASRHHYCSVPELKKPETKPTTKPASSSRRLSQQKPTMNDTYAVVNKPRQPPSPSPAYSTVSRASASSRSLPPSHHYDNLGGASAGPLYSTVKPRAKPNTLPPSATPIYDTASASANHRPGEGPPSLGNNGDYQLVSTERLPSATDDDYEDLSSDIPNTCSRDGIGFNCRIQKPRGPRDPPAEWSRLER